MSVLDKQMVNIGIVVYVLKEHSFTHHAKITVNLVLSKAIMAFMVRVKIVSAV